MADWLNDVENISQAVVQAVVQRFTTWVRSLRLGQPQPPIFISRKEVDMAWEFTFGNPPANTKPDWTKREFVATVDGVEQPPVAVEPKNTTADIEMTFPENASVSLVTRDYDDAKPTPLTRDSIPSEFVVNDTDPPDVPGAPIFKSSVEVPDA